MNNHSKFLLFIFFFITISSTLLHSQNLKHGNAYELPFSIFKTSNDTLSIESILRSNYKFVSKKSLKDKTSPSEVYWLKVDFKDQIDTLKTKDLWFLKLNTFSYSSLFYLKNNEIEKKVFGVFEVTNETESIAYNSNISFNKNSLINDRFLYLKVRRVRFFENVDNWQVAYISKTTNDIINNQYSWKTLKLLIPIYLFAGICIIMFVITFAFYTYFKEKQYLFYALYILSMCVYLCGNSLKIYDALFNNNNFISFWLSQILQILINICYVSFILCYLKTKVFYPKLHRAIKAMIYLLIIILVFDSLFIFLKNFTTHIYIMDFHRFIMILFGISGMIYLLKYNKERLAYFIVGGSFCYMMGSLGDIFLESLSIMLIGVSLEIIIFAFGLTYKMQQEHKQKMHFEKESYVNKTKALRAQINPHFIFNSLSSIQNLVTKNDKKQALNYLSKFGRLTRNILESSIDTNVLLSDEIKMLNDYLELESLRFNENFKFYINVDNELNTMNIEMPMLIFQPFVENAILHGLLNKISKDKVLTINFKKERYFMICEIDDNGIGRKASLEKKSVYKKKSRGLEVTEERLMMLNQMEKNKANIKILDKYDFKGEPTGTKVIIGIPID